MEEQTIIQGKIVLSNFVISGSNPYFGVKGEGYSLSDKVKELVHFENHNLVTDPFNSLSMVGIDIIFCRNVSIYFNLETTKQVIDRFHRSLNRPGYLFLGHSETMWKISDKYSTMEFKGAFIYRKDDSSNPVERNTLKPPIEYAGQPASIKTGPVLSEKPPGPVSNEDNSKTGSAKDRSVLAEATQALEAKNYDKAVSLLERIGADNPLYPETRMIQATLWADQGKDEEAISLLEEVVQKNSLSEEGYFLLGLLYKKTGNLDTSASMLERALYVNPENPLIYFHLAEIYRRQGKAQKARKNFKTTLKVLKSLPGDYRFLFSDELTTDLLSQTCSKELDRLDGS